MKIALIGVAERVGSRLVTELPSPGHAVTGNVRHVRARSAKSGSQENRRRSQYPG
jgi:putative NADH-flavin reductase